MSDTVETRQLGDPDDFPRRLCERRLEYIKGLRQRDPESANVPLEWLEQIVLENIGLHQTVATYRKMFSENFRVSQFPTGGLK